METKRMLPEGITRSERTRKLNEALRNAVPSVCVERALLFTESYKETEGMPDYIRRAKALKHMLEHMTIFIDEDELIVGNHGCRPRAALIFPETALFSKEELDLMPTRDVDTLQISEEDKRILLEEVFPYWKGKNVEDLSRYYIDPRILEKLDTPYRVFNPLSRARSGYGHYLPNIKKVLEIGFAGIEKETRAYLEALDFTDPQLVSKRFFYEAILIIIEGIKTFAARYSKLAVEMASAETNQRRARELELIAENCRQVPYYPAKTFWQALQTYWFVLLINYCEQNGSAISGGRVDQIFRPYYEKDLAEGRIVREEAGEMLEALWAKHIEIIKAGTCSSARNNGGFATTINVVLGGVDRNGEDAVNDLTWLCLEAEQAVFNSEPNTSVRLNKKNPDAFAEKVVQILAEKEGGKIPLFNDEQIIKALLRDGVEEGDALDYAIVGCVEPTSQGDTMGRTNAGFFNLAKCLELALFNGKCQMSGIQMGPESGDAETFTSIEQVKEAYEKQVHYFVKMMVSSLNSLGELHGKFGHIYSSMLVDGCLERGLDVNCGGAKYEFTGIQGVGSADVADSLTAINELVFKTQKYTMTQLLEGMRSNFSSDPIMKHVLLHKAPKYGNDIEEADQMMVYVTRQYCDEVRSYRDPYGGLYRAGLYCLSSNTPLGRQVCALPSGRESGTPLGDGGISPKHGMDTHGPTAVAKSVSKIEHSLAANGVNLNMKFLPTVLKTQADQKKLIQLVRAYFALGGMHIQFNVLSPETLMEAQKHPENYRSLVVRVAGYSAFFVELDRDVQNEIISRTIQQSI